MRPKTGHPQLADGYTRIANELLFVVRSPQAKRQVQDALNRHWEAWTRRFGNSLAPYVNTVREVQQKSRRGVALFQEIRKAHQVLWGKPFEEVLHVRPAQTTRSPRIS